MQDKRSSTGTKSRQRERQTESNYYSEEITGPVLDPIRVPAAASGQLRQDVESGYEGYEIQVHHYEYPADVDPSRISEDGRGYENNERGEEHPIYDYYEDDRPNSGNSHQEQPMYDFVEGSERGSHRSSYMEVVCGQPYDSYMTVSEHSSFSHKHQHFKP